jgi:peptidoglycan/xylan/chitin deacetylase (PgdA/CDA1 family)
LLRRLRLRCFSSPGGAPHDTVDPSCHAYGLVVGALNRQLIASCSPRKRAAARIVARTPLARLARLRDRRQPVVRIFNYHSVPRQLQAAFERQLDHLSTRFQIAGPYELEHLLREGPGEQSTAILCFDDGLANHAEIAAPTLERRGLRAIFAIPATFPGVPDDQQEEWFSRHIYPAPTELHPRVERRALTWAQARDLISSGHRICSHGHDHAILRPDTPPEVIGREVVESRKNIERELEGVTVDGFCWAGAVDPHADDADRLIRSTYAYSLGNNAHRISGGTSMYNIPRINLEASWPLEVIDLQVSGAMDLLFAVRRASGKARKLEPAS